MFTIINQQKKLFMSMMEAGLNSAPSEGIAQPEISQEQQNLELKANHLKKVQELSAKKSKGEAFTEQDKQALQAAKEFADAQLSYKDSADLQYKHFGELRVALSSLIEKSNETKKDSKSQRESLLQEKLLTPGNVITYLFDKNSDGSIDTQDRDTQFIDAIHLQAVKMDDQTLLASLSHLAGQDFQTKEALVSALQNTPELKNKILTEIQTLANAGVLPTHILQYGKEAVVKSLALQEQLDTIINVQNQTFESKYQQALAKLSPEQKVLLQHPEVKKGLFESLRMHTIGAMLSAVETKRGIGVGASFDHEDINKFLSEKTSNIVQNLSATPAFGLIDGKIVPGLAVTLAGGTQVTDTVDMYGSVGLFNFIPGVMVGGQYQYNEEDLQKAGFQDFDEITAKKVGLNANLNTLGWGAMLTYSEDKIQGIEQKKKDFSSMLDKVLTIANLSKDSVDNLSSDEKAILNNAKAVFTKYSVDINNDSFLISIKESFVGEWERQAILAAQKEGFEFSGAGIGVQFVAGYMPLPVLGARWTQVEGKYVENPEARLLAVLATSEESKSRKISESGKNVSKSLDKSNNDSIKEIMNQFNNETKLNYFVGLAQYNKNDWPKFVAETDFDKRVNIMKTMLTDFAKVGPKDKKEFFTSIVNKMKELQGKTDNESRLVLNQLLGATMDASFKDRRSIEEVVLGFTKAEGKNGKISKTAQNYDFLGWSESNNRYSGLVELTKTAGVPDPAEFRIMTQRAIIDEILEKKELSRKSQVSDKIDKKLTLTSEPNLFGFVASYKIDPQANTPSEKSLGRNLVEIPIGTANSVDGIKKDITSLKNKEFVNNKFIESEQGNALFDSIGAINFAPDQKQALLNGYPVTVDGKTFQFTDNKHVYFLYGRCANESMGIELGTLQITNTISGEVSTYSKVLANGRMDMVASSNNRAIGATWGNEKQDTGGANTTPDDGQTPKPGDQGDE